jgi:hypothetical protein
MSHRSVKPFARRVALLAPFVILLASATSSAQPRAEGPEELTVRPGEATSWATVRGRAGGGISAAGYGSTAHGTCAGFIGRSPDVVLTLPSDINHLTLRARSRRDITLVVSGPSGYRCNDDAVALNPVISGRFEAGVYEIYVGAFESDQTPRFTLGVMEMPAWNDRMDDEEDDDVVVTPPPPHHPGPGWHEPVTLAFRGAFEGNDVYFSGGTHEEVYNACVSYVSSARLSLVDDVQVFGRAMRNGPSFWNNDALCSIAVLNARPETGACAVSYTAGFEDVLFELHADDVDAARSVIRTYVPILAASGFIDDVNIGGRPYHNGPGFWSAPAVTEMLATGVRKPDARVVAVGDIEGAPFAFSGDTAADIIAECERYWDAVAPSFVDDLNVNGTARHNGPGFWQRAEACMIIGSLASAP